MGVAVKIGCGADVTVAVSDAAGRGVKVFSGVGEAGRSVDVGLGGIIVAVSVASTGGDSSVVIDTLGVAETSRGIVVNCGVRIVTVESKGGNVGIAPQDEKSKAVMRSKRSFGIDFIIYSLSLLNQPADLVLGSGILTYKQTLCKFFANPPALARQSPLPF